MKQITVVEIDELTDKLLRLEFPTYEKDTSQSSISHFKNQLRLIKAHLVYFLNSHEIEVLLVKKREADDES